MTHAQESSWKIFLRRARVALDLYWSNDLHHLGVGLAKAIPGGVHFSADWPACYAANLHSRIATRILWRVAHGSYGKEEDIYRLAYETPWKRWFGPGADDSR